MRKRVHPRPRRGFTLIEMLVVIAIIGVLVSMLIPAVNYAWTMADKFQIVTDMTGIEDGMTQYKEKRGDYPPDFSDVVTAANPSSPTAAEIAAWRRTRAYKHIVNSYSGIDPTELIAVRTLALAGSFNNANVIPFWLGGLSDDAKRPFTGVGGPLNGTTDRNMPLHDFDQKRLLGNATLPYYVPRRRTAPYVYFDSATYDFRTPATGAVPQFAGFGNATFGIARPLKVSEKAAKYNTANLQHDSIHWANRESFQIISAGRDDKYAPNLVFPDSNGNNVPVFTVFPEGQPFHPALYDPFQGGNIPPQIISYFDGQKDNLTNFSEGSGLGDLKQ